MELVLKGCLSPRKEKIVLWKPLGWKIELIIWKNFKSLILINRGCTYYNILSNSSQLDSDWLLSIFDLSLVEDVRLVYSHPTLNVPISSKDVRLLSPFHSMSDTSLCLVFKVNLQVRICKISSLLKTLGFLLYTYLSPCPATLHNFW